MNVADARRFSLVVCVQSVSLLLPRGVCVWNAQQSLVTGRAGTQIIQTHHSSSKSVCCSGQQQEERFVCVSCEQRKCVLQKTHFKKEKRTTLNGGYLGSDLDEERSELRKVFRVAEFSESSNL